MIVIRDPEGKEVTRVGASGDLIMAQLGLKWEEFWFDFSMLFVYLVAFMGLTLLLLTMAMKEKR